MTTKSRLRGKLKVMSKRETEISLVLDFPITFLIKMLLVAILLPNKQTIIQLTNTEIHELSKLLTRWKIIERLRTHKN